MRKNLFFRLWLLAFLMLAGISGVRADNVTATLEHTAGSQWGSNTGESTVDKWYLEHYNGDYSSGWAGAAYAKFSFTIPDGHKVVSATLTYSMEQNGDKGRSDAIYYMNKGFDLDWNTFAGQTGTDLRYTGSRTSIGSVTTVKGLNTNLQLDVTSAVNTISLSGQSYILFQWTGNVGGADLYGKASNDAPSLTIVTEYDTSVSVTFSDHNKIADITEVNFVEPTLVKRNIPSGAHLVFTSSKPDVARVNPLTGDVFLLDGTTSDDPVIITATVYNGDDVLASDSYQLIIKTVDDAEFRTEGNKSTAWVNGKFGTRKVEAVPNIAMHTGNVDIAKDITLIRELEGYKVATTLAGDGWRDTRFAADGVTPVEGTYYIFKPETNGTLKIEGLMISNTGVMFVDATDVTTNLLNPVPTYSSSSTLITIEQDVVAGHTYYLFGLNPYYCSTDRKVSENNGPIGHTDFSDDYWNVYSTTGEITIEPNQTLTMMFKMHTKNNPSDPGGAGDDDNFLLHIKDNINSQWPEELFLRGDANSNAGAGGKMDPLYSILEAGYEDVYPKLDGADVKLTVSRNYDAITATVMITCTDGTVYAKQQMLTANDPYANITAQAHPLGSYFTDFKAFRSSGWNVFELHSFEFTSDYRYDYVSLVYRDGQFYNALGDLTTPISDNKLETGTTLDGKVRIKQKLVGEMPGVNYQVDAYGDVDAIANPGPGGDLTIDPEKGGTYVVTATYNNNSARYILTIPYTTHKWKFGPEGTTTTMEEITGKKTQYDVEWRFNARLKQKDGTTGYMNSYSHPLICGKNTINGDNVLYVKNTDGLLFKTTSGSALGYSIDQKEGKDLAALTAAKLEAKKAELTSSQEYQQMSQEEKEAALAAVTVTPQEINRILYDLYANSDETTVENPGDMWLGYSDSKFTIPYAKAGQYVKIHWLRYTWSAKSGGNGSDFTASNLVDLDGKDISETFRITGYQGNYTAPYGNYIFKVKEDGPVTITKADNGWVTIADIELADNYSTDLMLIELAEDAENNSAPIRADLTDKPVSFASNGMTDAVRHFSCYAGQTHSANAKSSVISVTPSNDDVDIQSEEVLWFTSERGVKYNKFILTADHASGHGNALITEKVFTDIGDYVIDRLDSWVAVGTVTPQTYPRTWDFTAQNMDYATASKALMTATNGINAYGEWDVEGDETEAGSVTYALAVGDSFTSGQTVNVTKDEETVATITYGESGGNNFKAAATEGSVSGFVAYTEGNGTNGNKEGGTFYTITPNYDGTVEVAVVLNGDKAFYVMEDGTALSDYNGIKVTEKYYGTYSFPVTAEKSYKVYCSGSKLGFYGFNYAWGGDSDASSFANKNITKDTEMYLHTYNAEGGDKPLFADGSELTAGESTFPETIGVGVTAWDAETTDNIVIDGNALKGVKAFNVPMLASGDYVYVMASSAPTATVTAYSATTADGKTTYAEAEGASVSTQAAKYLGDGVYGFKVEGGENVNMDITFAEATDVYKIGVSNIEKTFDKYGFSTESRDKNIDYSFISAPAYAITENEFTYNYDKVSVTPTEKFGITPAGQGVMLYKSELADDKSPLFYAGNNILEGTDNLPEADNTLAGQNQLVGIINGGTIEQYQQNSDDKDCDAFVLTYIYSTYSTSAGGDIAENQDFGTDAFFRVKGSITAPANKAYLLVESDKLPKALWDGGNGQGTAGNVKNLVRINFGEDDDDDTPTAIENINITDNGMLDNATWYNLSGQKLNGKPVTKGVYIVNGKKVMIK